MEKINRRQWAHGLFGASLSLGAAAAGWPRLSLALPERAVPESARDALDVFQIKRVAQRKLAPADWHFIANGADDGLTMQANRDAFNAWQIRVRRLVDVSQTDTSVSLLGQRLPNPIILAPVGGQQALDPQGELATARGAGRNHLMICSTVTNYSVGEIAAAADGPRWFQLYASKDRELMKKLMADAEGAGCKGLVLTVDSPTRGNREAERWFSRMADSRRQRLGNFVTYPGGPRIGDASMTWDIIGWLREHTSMKIVLKGIVTHEDARLCKKYGVDGLIVSNHGGRQEESGRGTLACLPEVVKAIDGRMPVLIDGGFRRGTDIFKALALGADAVCIGRPYLWGLGAFGEAGVERVLRILRQELVRIMQFAGTTKLSAIGKDHLV